MCNPFFHVRHSLASKGRITSEMIYLCNFRSEKKSWEVFKPEFSKLRAALKTGVRNFSDFVFLTSFFQGWALARLVPTFSFWGIYSVIPINCIQLFLLILLYFSPVFLFFLSFPMELFCSCLPHKGRHVIPFCTQLMWISVICFLYLPPDNKAAALNPIYCSSLIHYFKAAFSIASFNLLSQLIESPKLLYYHFSVSY